MPGNISVRACHYLCRPDFCFRERPDELTGPTVALTMVIASAASAVTVIPVIHRAGMGYITGMTGFPGSGLTYGQCCHPLSVSMLVLCSKYGRSGMVSQHTAAQVASVAVIRILYCHSGFGETTIIVKGYERFGIHRGTPYCKTTRWRKPFRYGQHRSVNGKPVMRSGR